MNDAVPLSNRRSFFGLLATLVLVVLLATGLVGCGSGSSAQESDSTQGHPEIVVEAACSPSTRGAMAELATLYQANHPWITFCAMTSASDLDLLQKLPEVSLAKAAVPGVGVTDDPEEQKALDAQAAAAAKAIAEAAARAQAETQATANSSSSANASSSTTASSSSSSADANSSSSTASTSSSSSSRKYTANSFVITEGAATMNALEAADVTDANSRRTIATDSLVIIAKSGSQVTDLSLAQLFDGSHTFAVEPACSATGVKVRQVLAALGLYTDASGTNGELTGVLAADSQVSVTEATASASSSTASTSSQDSSGSSASASSSSAASEPLFPQHTTEVPVATVEESVSATFKDVSEGKVDFAIVKKSDVYRFGGVSIVGTVPTDAYTSITYTVALTTALLDGVWDADDSNSSVINKQKQTDMQDFLSWCTNDSAAQVIWAKWGLTPVSQ